MVKLRPPGIFNGAAPRCPTPSRRRAAQKNDTGGGAVGKVNGPQFPPPPAAEQTLKPWPREKAFFFCPSPADPITESGWYGAAGALPVTGKSSDCRRAEQKNRGKNAIQNRNLFVLERVTIIPAASPSASFGASHIRNQAPHPPELLSCPEHAIKAIAGSA